MLERMWRNGNPLALLVGMQTGAATLQNSMEVPQNIKNSTTLQPSNCITRYLSNTNPRYLPKTDVLFLRGTCTPMFIAALLTIAKVWKEPKCPSMDEWIKKIWYVYTMEYYLGIKKNEILPFATTWMELEGIMLSEISQSERDKNHMTSRI